MIEYYITTDEASSVMTEVEMDYIETAPQEERPWLLWAFFKMNEVDEKGFPTASELSGLQAAAMSLEEALTSELDAVYVGQRYAEGWMELYFYAPTAKRFQTIVTEHASARYVFDSGSSRDAKWEYYRYTLYPDALMQQQIQSRDIIAELKEAGDDLSRSREVEHYLQFQTEANAKRAGEKLALEGFAVKEISYDSGEEYAHVLTLTKEHCIDEELLEKLARTLTEAASKEHGLYAGWSTALAS